MIWKLSVVYLKHDVSDTGFCLLLQVEPTQLGPIDRASLFVQTLATTTTGFIKPPQHKPLKRVNISTPLISTYVVPNLSVYLSIYIYINTHTHTHTRDSRCGNVTPIGGLCCVGFINPIGVVAVMTYACPSWEFAAEIHLLKLQCLQNRVLCTIGNFPGHTSVCDMHVAFQIYDYITKLCRKQAEGIQNQENENVHYLGQGEAQHRKYKRLKLGGGHLYGCSSVWTTMVT
jgi:hypothetical protein